MTRIALGLEYDGHFFHGWQRQPALPTIQGHLENALSQIADTSITTVCAGRTDAGVHATAQVVHFDCENLRPLRSWIFGTNTLLPGGIRILWAKEVPDTFNARFSATGRRYRYVIYNHPIRPSLLRHHADWDYRKLDARKMQAAAQHWVGEHDFSSFRAAECQSLTPVRTIHAIQIVRIGDQVVIDMVATAFLHHMVRNMVGVLKEIGSGELSTLKAKQILEAKDRKQAGVTASPFGLYLVEVQYPSGYDLPLSPIGPWFLKTTEGSLLI